MADKEISALTAAAALTGAELLHVLQGANSRKATLPIWQLDDTWDHAIDGDSASADFIGLAGAQDIMILAQDVTKSVSGTLAWRVSVNNGSTYFSTSGDYAGIANTGIETVFTTGGALHETSATAARSGIAMAIGAHVSGGIKLLRCPLNTSNSQNVYFTASTSPINAVQVIPSGGGNLTGGEIYCLIRGIAAT